MKRFVVHFNIGWGEGLLEDQINSYAERRNVEIITIAPSTGDGIYVLFEEKEGKEDDR